MCFVRSTLALSLLSSLRRVLKSNISRQHPEDLRPLGITGHAIATTTRQICPDPLNTSTGPVRGTKLESPQSLTSCKCNNLPLAPPFSPLFYLFSSSPLPPQPLAPLLWWNNKQEWRVLPLYYLATKTHASLPLYVTTPPPITKVRGSSPPHWGSLMHPFTHVRVSALSCHLYDTSLVGMSRPLVAKDSFILDIVE